MKPFRRVGVVLLFFSCLMILTGLFYMDRAEGLLSESQVENDHAKELENEQVEKLKLSDERLEVGEIDLQAWRLEKASIITGYPEEIQSAKAASERLNNEGYRFLDQGMFFVISGVLVLIVTGGWVWWGGRRVSCEGSE